MLVRRILPCQRRTCYLWEFDPAKHQALLELFGTTHEDIWKVLFKANEMWPETIEDCRHDLAHPTSSVSFPCFKVYPLLAYSRRMSELSYLFFQGWTKKAERIQCLDPLPEEPASHYRRRCWFQRPTRRRRRRPRGAKVALAARVLRT